MHCPVCRHKDTNVVDSRISTDGISIRRRRECDRCSYRFSTLEEIELLDLTVVKNDGRHEGYSRDKVLQGIKKALEKRPYTESDLQKLIHRVETDIQKKKRREVKSSEIGEIIMKHLLAFDTIAYIRFASVYRSFEDVRMFENELKKLRSGVRGNFSRVKTRKKRRK